MISLTAKPYKVLSKGANVEQGTTVYTDDHRGYLGLKNYQHKTVKHSAKQYVNGMATRMELRAYGQLSREVIMGYHNFSKKHLNKYINKFSFRLNEGNCKIDTQERLDNLFTAMQGKIITYKELTAWVPL